MTPHLDKLASEGIRFTPFYVNAWFVDSHATLNPSEEQVKPYNHLNARGVKHKAAAFVGRDTERTRALMWEWRYRVFGHTLHKSPILAIRYGKWKLLMNPDCRRVECVSLAEAGIQQASRAFVKKMCVKRARIRRGGQR